VPRRSTPHMPSKGDPICRSLMPFMSVTALPRMYWEAGEFKMKSPCLP
jgi:hypothetical protein